MDTIIQKIEECRRVDEATELLYKIIDKTELIEKAYKFAEKHHRGITRKSGEDYFVHPILVASLTAHFNGNEAMVCSALLHDVVEDSECTINDIEFQFGKKIANLVDGLTKIYSNEKSFTAALSFGKLLKFSKKSPEILVIKLCDRLHNMLTLDALPREKQIRIAEESLNIYAGIAHKLGISVIKNGLEDLAFKYLQPEEYKKIDDFINSHEQDLHLKLNHFIERVSQYIYASGINKNDFFIEKRIKHYYSIFLKMQKKGISIEEVTDLLAIRIVLKEKLDCYKVLGALHTSMVPLISRFKDYIANPKDNGYQTIHTMFFFEGSILEAQIRTIDMHRIAEHGIAAHWKYKGKDIKIPNLSWLEDIDYHNKIDEELAFSNYKDAQQSILAKSEILVYSKDGETFNLPAGSKVLDFAYNIHTEVGDRADKAYVNKKRVSLLTPLKTGDEVRIVLSKEPHYKCSWINDLVTIRAKKALRQACRNKQIEIDTKVGRAILREIFKIDKKTLSEWLKRENLLDSVYKVATNSKYLIDVVIRLKKYAPKILNPFLSSKRFIPQKQKFTNIVVYSNQNFKNVIFDYCCHPKRGDEIIGFSKDKNEVVVHHKMCKEAQEMIDYDEPMVFVKWTKDIPDSYEIVFTLENKVAALSNFLKILAINGVNLVQINSRTDKEVGATFFQALIEKRDSNFKELKDIIAKSCKLVEFRKYEDPYKI